MSKNPMWRRYLRFWGPDLEADVRDELEFHLDMRTRELTEAGWSSAEARAEAQRLFGKAGEVRQECIGIGRRREKATRRLELLNGIGQDLRRALRLLRARPGFTAVVVLSLGLGIGANTAIFSLIKAVLLERLPVDDPEELVVFNWMAGSNEDWVNHRDPNPRLDGHHGWMRRTDSGRQLSTSFSYAAFQHFLESEGTLSDTFAFATLSRLNVNLGRDNRSEMAEGMVVSGGYFTGLGLSPHLGRLITDEDDRPASDPVTVLSYRFWRSRFGSDPSVVGRTVSLNGSPFTIVGVTPAGFAGTSQVGSSPSFYVPLAVAQQARTMPRVRPTSC